MSPMKGAASPMPRGNECHPWDDLEVSDDEAPDDPYENEDIEDDSNPVKRVAATTMELLENLLMLFMMSRISAQQFCILCFNAGCAGLETAPCQSHEAITPESSKIPKFPKSKVRKIPKF